MTWLRVVFRAYRSEGRLRNVLEVGVKNEIGYARLILLPDNVFVASAAVIARHVTLASPTRSEVTAASAEKERVDEADDRLSIVPETIRVSEIAEGRTRTWTLRDPTRAKLQQAAEALLAFRSDDGNRDETAFVEVSAVPAEADQSAERPGKQIPTGTTVASDGKVALEPKPAKRNRGDAEALIVAQMTRHHKCADGGCLNVEPIGNNELAELAKVGRQTVSSFFKRHFGGHGAYKRLCRENTGTLALKLSVLNGEARRKGLHYFGRNPPSERPAGDD